MMQNDKGKLPAKNKTATRDEKEKKPGCFRRILRALGKRVKGGERVGVDEQENKRRREQQGATATAGLTDVNPPVKAAERSSCGPPQPPSATTDGAQSKSNDSQRVETVVRKSRVDDNSNALPTSTAETNPTTSTENLLDQTSPEHIASMIVDEAPTIRASGVDQNQLDDTPENGRLPQRW
jgi:hypothetical protein